MKKILFLLSILLFTSCDIDKYKSREIVEKTFKNAEVYQIQNYSFVVIDSVGVHYVRCTNLTDNEISSINTLKRWQKTSEKQ